MSSSSSSRSCEDLISAYKRIVANRRQSQLADRERERAVQSRAASQGVGSAVILAPLPRRSAPPSIAPSADAIRKVQLVPQRFDSPESDRTWTRLTLDDPSHSSQHRSYSINQSRRLRNLIPSVLANPPVRSSSHSQSSVLALSRSLFSPRSAADSSDLSFFSNSSFPRPPILPLIDRKVTPVDELMVRLSAESEREEKSMDQVHQHRYGRSRRFSITNIEQNDQIAAGSLDLMALLDNTKLEYLRSAFLSRAHPLSIEEFVELMVTLLPVDSIGEMRLTSFLVEFFRAVDLDASGSIEFSELTQYIAEMGGSKGLAVDKLLSGSDGGSEEPVYNYSTVGTYQIDPYESSSVIDRSHYESQIERLIYLNELDHLIAVQSGQAAFQVKSGKTLQNLCKVHGHSGPLISAEYLNGLNCVATGGSDSVIRLWDYQDYYRVLPYQIINPDRSAFALRWIAPHNMLFSAGEGNLVRAWKFHPEVASSLRSGPAANQLRFNPLANSASHAALASTLSGHDDLVLDLLFVDSMGSLATASLDHSIGIYDLTTGQRSATMRGHKKGVFQLAFSDEFHCLISAGHEHSAIVWNPFVSHQVCKLKGHYSPLVSVQAIPNSPQLLTADSQGCVKIWDCRNWSCIQSLHIEDSSQSRVTEVNQMVAMPAHRRFAVAIPNERIYLFDSVISTSFHAPAIADLDPPNGPILVNSSTGQFISVHGTCLKFWDDNGQISRIYRSIVRDFISAMCSDDGEKKLILADCSGGVTVINAQSGAKLKTWKCFGATSNVPMHARELAFATYVPGVKHLLLSGRSGQLFVLDEGKTEELLLIKELNITEGEITAVAYSHLLSLYAAGAANGGIFLYDDRASMLVGEVKLPAHKSRDHRTDSGPASIESFTSEITALAFLAPFPLLVAADADQNVFLFSVRPVQLPLSRCLMRFRHSSVITALAFDPANLTLCGGDSNGSIQQWQMEKLICEQWKLSPFFTLDTPGWKEIMAEREQEHEPNSDPRSVSYSEYRKRHLHFLNYVEDRPREHEQTIADGIAMPPSRAWRGHTEAINSLTIGHTRFGTGTELELEIAETRSAGRAVNPAEYFLASTSFDRKIRLWSVDGAPLGDLQQGRAPETADKLEPWKFQSDAAARQAKREKNAEKVLRTLRQAGRSTANWSLASSAAPPDSARSEIGRLARPRVPPLKLPISLPDPGVSPLDSVLTSPSRSHRDTARAVRDSWRKQRNPLKLPYQQSNSKPNTARENKTSKTEINPSDEEKEFGDPSRSPTFVTQSDAAPQPSDVL